jgi:branched-chain amino acid transport system permease protein
MVGESVFSTVMLTIGLSAILTSVAGLIWGHDVYALPSPFTNKTGTIGGIVLSLGYIYTVVVTIIFLILFILFFNRSLLGIAMRGTAEDQNTASLMGINVKRVFMVTWAIGTLVACVAGIFLAEQSFVFLAMSHTGIKAMAAAILGGMNSIGGAILGGILVGIVENFSATYLSGMEIGNFHFGDIKDVAAFAVMIIVLIIRPNGIFGTEKIERV